MSGLSDHVQKKYKYRALFFSALQLDYLLIGARKDLSSAYDKKKEKAIIYKLSAFSLAPLFPGPSIVFIHLYCHLRLLPMHIRFSFFPFSQKMSSN
jgi:hypothetical protein